MLYERYPNKDCSKGEELHKYVHLWSVLLCQGNTELYQAMYDLVMYTKHAHSCRCGAGFGLNAFTDYIYKYGDNSDELMKDHDKWLKSGPNCPPKTSKQNLYACGLAAWLCVHAYGDHNLNGNEYDDVANTLLLYCVNERVLASNRPMDSGMDVKTRQESRNLTCYKIIINRKQALKGLAGMGMRPEVAKMLVLHSLGYIWLYGYDAINMLSVKGEDTCEIVARARIYKHISNENIDVYKLCSMIWGYVEEDEREAIDISNDNIKKTVDDNNYLCNWSEHMKNYANTNHTYELFRRVMRCLACECNKTCEKRIEAYMMISIIVANTVLGGNEYTVGYDDIKVLQTTWQQLVLDSNGCRKEISAIIFSSSSVLWSINK